LGSSAGDAGGKIVMDPHMFNGLDKVLFAIAGFVALVAFCAGLSLGWLL
jgi:hypothetical protein